MARTLTARRLVWAVAALPLVAALGGCAALGIGDDGPERDEETGQVLEPTEMDVFELQVGDCLNLATDDELATVPVVPCSDAHTDEIYHSFELEDEEWPGTEAVQTAADAGCYDAFEGFVGMAYSASTLDYNYLSPLEEGWNDPQLEDRLVQCVIYEPADNEKGAAELTGTLEGAAR